LVSVTAADQFWQLLPREDPVAAQRAVSEVLSTLMTRDPLRLGQFRALLALDQLARGLGDALLSDYATGRPSSPSPETNAWQSACALSRSFGQAFERALRHIREEEPARGWREHIVTVLLRLFQHRQVEFLLQPFTTEHSIHDCWIGLHGAYLYAESAGALSQPLMSRRCHEECGEASTLEREYIHVLLLQFLNGGHLSPYEAFWLNRQIPRWCGVLSLRPDCADAVVGCEDHRFVVDLDSAAGLARPSRSPAGTLRYLDPAPMLALIRDEIASLRDPARPADRLSPLRRSRQLKLLGTVGMNCLPKPAPIRRRGARLPATSTVEAVVGLARITRMLHHEMRRKTVADPSALPGVEAGADTVTGGTTAATAPGVPSRGGRDPAGTTGESGASDQVWQVRDRSESGCRLRGRILNPNRVLPGALVAFREHDDAPWTLAVVRRLRKRIGDRIDIGVEYVGRNPLVVNLATEADRAEQARAAPDRKRRPCAALHLQESSGHPPMPFKTLILAPREFSYGRCLNLRSDGAEYRVQLKEPIEEQDGFVWLPYEVVSRPATVGQAQDRPYGGKWAITPGPNRSPLAARPAAAAELTLPTALRRAGGTAKT
jgi:hypothetical protein